MYHFCVCDIFFSPSGYPINSIFQCQFVDITYFDGTFLLLTIRMPMVTKHFRVVTCREAYAWYLNGVVLLGHLTNTIQISTCRRCIDIPIRQGADIELETLKHDPLIKWPTWGRVAVWKIYISIFMRFKLVNLVGCWL